jgi:deoxyribonuclease IV
MAIIGAHVSSAGGLYNAFDNALKIEAECMQIFITPPQIWNQITPKPEVVEKYLERQKETDLGPNFIHGCYLINLATDSPENLRKGIEWLIYSLKTASQLKLTGTIFHLGSHKGRGFESVKAQIRASLEEILENTPKDTYLILENSAGTAIGGRLNELGELIKDIKNPRLKVCVDTQHAFASGYDLRNKEGVEKLVSEIDSQIGIENLIAIHTNDSKTELGSGRDRHENLGVGLIGIEGFKFLVNHPKLKDLPFILEVPGLDDKGPDKANVDILKELIK